MSSATRPSIFVYLPWITEYLTPEAVTMSIFEISMTVIQAGSQPVSQPANKVPLYTILKNNDSSYRNTFVYPPLGSNTSGI